MLLFYKPSQPTVYVGHQTESCRRDLNRVFSGVTVDALSCRREGVGV